MLSCAAGSNLRQRFIRKCNPPVVGSGAYRCPPDTDGNTEEKEADCASSSPVCYEAYPDKCGCSKDTSNVPSSHAVGDGTTQGSCSTSQSCYGDGKCKDDGSWTSWEMLGCAAGSNVRQRFIRKCDPPVVGSGTYRCPPDPDGNLAEKETDCASSSPACYDTYRGICGCSKDTSNVPSTHAVGDGTTQGSCSTNQVCGGDGKCKDKGIFLLVNYLCPSQILILLVLQLMRMHLPIIFI